jgi:hypothetical protein
MLFLINISNTKGCGYHTTFFHITLIALSIGLSACSGKEIKQVSGIPIHILPADIDTSSDELSTQEGLISQGKYLSMEGEIKFLMIKTSYTPDKPASRSEMVHTKSKKDEHIYIEDNEKIFISLLR